MIAAWTRIMAVAANTLTETFRQKTPRVLIVFGVVVLGGSFFFTNLTFQAELKFLKDLVYAAVSVTGLLIALIGAAQLIPAEIERRTIYTTLSKPMRRVEFIAGKYLGLAALLTLALLAMGAIGAGVLTLKASIFVSACAVKYEAKEAALAAAEIWRDAQDPSLLYALLLLWAKLCVVAVICVFFSTFATSTIYIVSMTLLVYFAGHLQSVAREAWMAEGGVRSWFVGAVAMAIPDFEVYNLIDEVIAGTALDSGYVAPAIVYSIVYTIVALLTSAAIFAEREL